MYGIINVSAHVFIYAKGVQRREIIIYLPLAMLTSAVMVDIKTGTQAE